MVLPVVHVTRSGGESDAIDSKERADYHSGAKGESQPTRLVVVSSHELCFPAINHNVIRSRLNSRRPRRKVIIRSAIKNIDQPDFFVVVLTIPIGPPQYRLVGIRTGEPGPVHHHK